MKFVVPVIKAGFLFSDKSEKEFADNILIPPPPPPPAMYGAPPPVGLPPPPPPATIRRSNVPPVDVVAEFA
jgi:hypothetical protein